MRGSHPVAWSRCEADCRSFRRRRILGNPIDDVVRGGDDVPNLAGFGINCTAPRHVSALLQAAQAATEAQALLDEAWSKM